MRSLDGIEDLLANPKDFGFCTFQEFQKNRDYWMTRRLGRHDEEVASIDAGDPNLGCKQKYFMDTDSGIIRLEALEDGERIAADMGLNFFRDFLVKPQVRHDPGSRRGYYTEVTFVPKRRLAARASA